ncbi:hypothetical protein DRJ22_05670 [Candidatus Woesearchaeota archaeon]|nr:MAG: hypothetical protein B6U93_04390 [Candidatus Woesearchaeota archaeon ex4484_78]RLE44650.1 MAG: hypothetical protein DRJ22_05670 [Candidatus Woesearchaeota archaeon]
MSRVAFNFGLKENFSLSELFSSYVKHYGWVFEEYKKKKHVKAGINLIEDTIEILLRTDRFFAESEAKSYLSISGKYDLDIILDAYSSKLMSLLEQKEPVQEQLECIEDRLGDVNFVFNDEKNFSKRISPYFYQQLCSLQKQISKKRFQKFKKSNWKFAYGFLLRTAYERLKYALLKERALS